MNKQDSKYRVSKAISISIQDRDQIQLVNLANRKKVDINKSAFLILQKVANSIFNKSDFLNFFPEPHTQNGIDFFNFLIETQMLVLANHKSDEVYFIDYNYRLFNVNKGTYNVTGKTVVIGIPFQNGNASAKGVSNAPAYLRNTCKDQNIDLKITTSKTLNQSFNIEGGSFAYIFDALRDQSLVDIGDLFYPTHGLPDLYYSKIEKVSKNLFKRKNRPMFIGGDHSVTLSIIKGLAKQGEKFGVLHFDAHSDLYTHPLDLEFASISTHNHGNFVKEVLQLDNLYSYNLIGIRGLNTISIPQHKKLSIYYASMISKDDDWISRIDDQIPYYLTFDIDVLDYSIAPATSTPVPRGLELFRTVQLLSLLLNRVKIIGADIVEIDAKMDKLNLTANSALSIILTLLASLCKSND